MAGEDRSTVVRPAGDYGAANNGFSSSQAKAESRKVSGSTGNTPLAGNDSTQGAKPTVVQKGEFTPQNN